MKTAQLSPLMREALAMANSHGGHFERLPGGYWTYLGCERTPHDGLPRWYVGTPTVQALVSRKLMEYTRYRQRRRDGGEFPIAASVVS